MNIDKEDIKTFIYGCIYAKSTPGKIPTTEAAKAYFEHTCNKNFITLDDDVKEMVEKICSEVKNLANKSVN